MFRVNFMSLLLSFLMVLSFAPLRAQIAETHLPIIDQKYFGSKEMIALPDAVFYQLKDNTGRSSKHLEIPIYGQLLSIEAIPNQVYIDDDRTGDNVATFDVKLPNTSNVYGALTYGGGNVYITIFNFGKTISIYPVFDSPGKYWVEYGVQPEMNQLRHFCTEHHDVDDIERVSVQNNSGLRSTNTMGSKIYEYNVALVCTGEYYKNNGSSDNTVRTSMINSLNAISAIFKNELSYILKTSSSIIKMYNDENTDPFNPSGNRVQMAREVIHMNFTPNRYNIGHVFHTHGSNDGWEGGGVALLQAVCNEAGTAPAKAGGWSGSFSNQGNGWINLAAHEFAHQFGASHTFNGTGGACTDNISSETAVEIGSGTTIMSYNGLCDNDQNIPGSGVLDNYFQIVSLDQMYNFVYNGNGGKCGTNKNSENLLPEVVANPCNANYVIPRNTPFYLEAKGTFPDSDLHTFCWEQIDEDGSGTTVTQGKVGTRAANDSGAPIFRSYPPTSVPYRYFPALSSLNLGVVNPFDILPNVARTLNFNVSLRDNNKDGGAVANDDIQVQVANSGPFVISFPVGGEMINAGIPIDVKWNTNGSNALCAKVRIKLSFDGGNTFNFVLADNVNYSAGTHTVTIPASVVATKDAKVMIECMDYECFKIFTIANKTFEILSDCIAPATKISPTTLEVFLEGDPGLKLDLQNNVGKVVANIAGSVRNNDADGNLIFLNSTPAVCAGPSNANKYDVLEISVDRSGSYTFNDGAPFGSVMNLYEFEFTGTNCTNHISSSATRPSGTGSITVGNTLTANLTAGKLYFITVGSFSSDLPSLPFNYRIALTNQPPGSNLYDGVYLPDGYIYTYIAVNSSTDVIAAVSDDADFTSLRFGEYCVYGVISKDTNNPTTWIGKTVSQAVIDGSCLQISTNCKSIVVNAGCRILSVTPGVQTPCILATNVYTQELVFTYDRAPESGKIIVNGQEFDVTTSPQTIVLTNLDSDGLPVEVNAHFSEIPDCRFKDEALFTAPKNCCPLEVELGANVEKCVGESVTLDAGAGGATYVWRRDGVEIAGSTGRTITVMTTGQYEAEVTHASGCKQIDVVGVTFHELPQVVIPANLHFCEGETYEIEPSISGSNRIEWYKDGVLIPAATDPTLEVNEGGVYRIVIFNQFNCTNEATTTIERVKAPVVDLGPEQSKCDGEIVVLFAGTEGSQYEWFYNGTIIPDATTLTYNALKSGIYSVIVTNDKQCSSNAQVKINFFASPEVDDFPAPIVNACIGETVTLSTSARGFNTIKWEVDGVLSPLYDARTEINVTEAGIYTIVATNTALCSTKKSVEVRFGDLPVIDLGEPTLVSCIGNAVTLDAGPEGETYEWSRNGTVLSEQTRTISVSTEGSYKVVVTNEFGCSAQDQIDISFIPGPSVSISGDASFCEGESHTITISTDATNPEIKWFDANGQIAGATSSSLNVNQSGLYRVSVKGGMPACEVFKEVNITVNPNPVVDLGADIAKCEGESFPSLDAGANFSSYNWTVDGVQLSTIRTVNPAQAGTYRVEVTNTFGCKGSDEVVLSLLSVPNISNLDDVYRLCEGKSLDLTIVSSGTIFEWKKDGVVIPGNDSKSILITTGGNYEVTASNAANCVASRTFVVSVFPTPVVDLGTDFTLCPGETRTINAGEGYELYRWNVQGVGHTYLVQNNATSEATTETVYSVTVFTSAGCEASDSVKVTSIPKVEAKITSNQPGVCNGEPVTLTASGGTTYTWNDPLDNSLSSLTGSQVVANPNNTTTYTVNVSDGGTCPDNTSSASIEIKIYEPVNVSAGIDTCVVKGKTIKLQATGGISYQWNHQELIVGNSNIANPEIKISTETLFTVTITDANGCNYTDDVFVCVREPEPELELKLVNIITPNGDGKNDELYFGDLSEYPDNRLVIFNRWGTTIFEANGYQHIGKLFDGTRRGERLPADTYYYVLTLGDETYKSALTILWD